MLGLKLLGGIPPGAGALMLGPVAGFGKSLFCMFSLLLSKFLDLSVLRGLSLRLFLSFALALFLIHSSWYFGSYGTACPSIKGSPAKRKNIHRKSDDSL